MLNVFFGEMPEAIYNTNVYFNNTFKDRWITSDLGTRIIKDIDKSDVVSANMINSPVLGAITPYQLSGGVKALLLIANDRSGNVFNASTCGDNCAKWILSFAENKKVVVNLRHLMDFGKKDFKIRVVNTDKIVKNMAELVSEAGEFV